VHLGLLLPQGFYGEYEGWDPIRAWKRTHQLAVLGQQLGFESIWTGEHVQSRWGGEQACFDCLTLMSALSQSVDRVRLGFGTLCSPFRNPALTAKMAATIDVVSGGRLILGLGAGWAEAEFMAYGYPFPRVGQRLAMLDEHLQIITRMVTADAPPVTFEGRFARVDSAVNNPRGVQRPRIPILVGGHGPNLTFRLGARYADEMSIDLLPHQVASLLPVLRQRCEEIGRDPASLALVGLLGPSWPWKNLRATGGQRLFQAGDSAAIPGDDLARIGTRQEGLALLKELGCSRVITGVPGLANTDETLYELLEDCHAAGIPIGAPTMA
jgi:alkanesulfonate monooxygenase SsuD/methylene tetrahydromethanopterin reductase-like flavin-dependent oxidoreductase (luciferase family)